MDIEKENKGDELKTKITNMYIAARQFKRAVPRNKILTIPPLEVICGNVKLNPEQSLIAQKKLYSSFASLIEISIEGTTPINRTFPYIVNTTLSCEIYLKIILVKNGFTEDDFKRKHKHNLLKLYNDIDEKFKANFKNRIGIDNEEICKNIKHIANAFEEWRYVYEHIENELSINRFFLEIFCDELDKYCINLIKDTFDYDITKSPM